MIEMDFLNLNVSILKEFLEDIPEEYMVVVDEYDGNILPIMNFDVNDATKEFILKIGDLNRE